MKLTDADLKELKKKKSSFPGAVAEDLHVAISEFAGCSRSDFFETVPLQEFITVKGAAGKKLGAHTFGDICQMGAVSICALSGVGQSAVKELVAVLRKLSSGESAESESDSEAERAAEAVIEAGLGYGNGIEAALMREAPPAVRTIEAIAPGGSDLKALSEDDVPVYNSVAAEKQITESFRLLKSADRFDEFKDRLLEDFWDKEIIRAPFVEAMSVRELVGIPVPDLLKKRSFGNRKIHGLLVAMERCLETFGGDGQEKMQQDDKVAVSTEPSAELKSINIDEIWGDLPASIGDPVKMILYELSFFGRNLSGAGSPLQRVAKKLPEVADAVCILGAMLGTEYSNETVCRILRVTSWDLMAREKYFPDILNVVNEECKEMIAVWEPLLQSAGVSERKLFSDRLDPAFSQEIQRMLCRMILKLMDAKNPEYNAKRVDNYWTTNPKAFGRQLESILVIMPMSDENLREDLSTLFPEIEQEVLIDLMKQIAAFNEESCFWRRR